VIEAYRRAGYLLDAVGMTEELASGVGASAMDTE
jgi:hypothetical protein